MIAGHDGNIDQLDIPSSGRGSGHSLGNLIQVMFGDFLPLCGYLLDPADNLVHLGIVRFNVDLI